MQYVTYLLSNILHICIFVNIKLTNIIILDKLCYTNSNTEGDDMMFSRIHMTVIDWWLFFLLMAIPLVNIIVFILLLVSAGTNKSLKNYLLALILPIVIMIVLFATGMISMGLLGGMGG